MGKKKDGRRKKIETVSFFIERLVFRHSPDDLWYAFIDTLMVGLGSFKLAGNFWCVCYEMHGFIYSFKVRAKADRN